MAAPAPAPPNFKPHQNTAAALLSYTPYQKPLPNGTSEQCWTRFASANEGFNVGLAGANQYLVKFANNFSKKHLATFSKKEWKTQTEAWLQSQQPGQQGQDAANWDRAQKQLLENKIMKVLNVRAIPAAGLCVTCGHPQFDLPGNPNTGHSNSGNCKVPGCGCATKYKAPPSAYETSRTAAHKPDVNPLSGAPTAVSSCIVLNWIPLNEFQTVVGNSILAVDPTGVLAVHPPGKGPGTSVNLRWNFTMARAGAIRKSSVAGGMDPTLYTWCEVAAKKKSLATAHTPANWEIVHWHAEG